MEKERFRKKEIFHAEQWFPGKDVHEVKGDTPDTSWCGCVIVGSKYANVPHVHVSCNEYVLVDPGDWIVTDKNGKVSVCRQEDFDRLYEKI